MCNSSSGDGGVWKVIIEKQVDGSPKDKNVNEGKAAEKAIRKERNLRSKKMKRRSQLQLQQQQQQQQQQ